MADMQYPDFTNTAFLEKHIQSVLAFYEPRVLATDGFYQCFKDNGDVYDTNTRHLVSSTRFIFNYATAYRLYGTPHYKQWAEHGLEHLCNVHQQANGNFAWVLNDGKVVDGNAMAYGHAFVMLCAASCVNANIPGGMPLIEQSWQFVEEHFFDPAFGAYADERDAYLKSLSPYRGQNANMHMCEALIAAWQSTNNKRYLDRAELLANKFCFELSSQSDGLIWEHYDTEWNVDMQYNIDKPDDLFKPWGFQPGHQIEWAKLLMQLHDELASLNNSPASDSKYSDKAQWLFNSAMQKGWDAQYKGLVYGFGPSGEFADTHKYFWVHAEAIAAAWRLYRATGQAEYLDHYQQLWQYSWTHLIDHEYGAWFRIRNRDGSAFDDLKSPPGKTDYHTMGAVWDVLSQHAVT